MVAAEPLQLQAEAQHGPHQHNAAESLSLIKLQPLDLDLLHQKQPPAADLSSEQAPGDKLRYFNWDQRDTARAAMQTLVAALSEDPINSYFTGSRKRQRRFVKDEVKGYLKALPRAANFIATADSKAVALWQLLPAETPRNELWAGWTRILAVSPRKWAQLVRLELHYEEAHEAIATAHGAYYYLSFIGTAPEARGRGLGSRLLQEITSRADREGRWCLLEATSEKSEALYARHGFVTYEVFRVAKLAPPVFLMKRAPAAAATPTAAAAGDKGLAAALGPLSPVFSITAITTSTASGVSILRPIGSSSDGCAKSSNADLVDLAAAVVAKEALGGSIGNIHSSISQPASPLIAVGREGHVEEELLLAATTGCGSNDSNGSNACKQQEPSVLLPLSTPVDAHVLISSGSSNSLSTKAAATSSAAATPASAVAAAAAIVASSNGSSKQGESPVEYGVSQDEAGCDSSSPAGAGGPSAAAAVGC